MNWVCSVNTFVCLCQFQELDYELRRQAGSAYVGQRLAKGTSHQDNSEQSETRDGASPNKLANNIAKQQTDIDILQVSSGYSIVM